MTVAAIEAPVDQQIDRVVEGLLAATEGRS
jgi:hypothetical protein